MERTRNFTAKSLMGDIQKYWCPVYGDSKNVIGKDIQQCQYPILQLVVEDKNRHWFDNWQEYEQFGSPERIEEGVVINLCIVHTGSIQQVFRKENESWEHFLKRVAYRANSIYANPTEYYLFY